jgi:hypothetical protein
LPLASSLFSSFEWGGHPSVLFLLDIIYRGPLGYKQLWEFGASRMSRLSPCRDVEKRQHITNHHAYIYTMCDTWNTPIAISCTPFIPSPTCSCLPFPFQETKLCTFGLIVGLSRFLQLRLTCVLACGSPQRQMPKAVCSRILRLLFLGCFCFFPLSSPSLPLTFPLHTSYTEWEGMKGGDRPNPLTESFS